MAEVKIERLISVSSEDPSYPALNLLKNNASSAKWKCKTPGEKQAAVELQLYEPSKIVSIDVGNEFSAFLEVLVSKSCNADDYKVLLVTSALMSLQDAKYGTNGNEVRFFKPENLCKPVMTEKWDRVKIICSQPYNKQLKYGLSFVVFHTIKEEEPSQEDSLSLGKFKFKVEPTDDPITVGGLFARRKEIVKPELKGAAAIRAASLPSAIKKGSPLSQENGSQGSSSTSGVVEQSSSPSTINKKGNNNAFKREPRQKNASEKKVIKNGNANMNQSSSVNGTARKTNPVASTSTSNAVPKISKKENQKPKRVKAWNRLFDDVVFVMSGFQNPLRSEIRSKALAMGAKFKPDWESSCTHLICAFVNTPKFAQVKGRGKIVRKEWIEECYSKRTRFPWRRYALDKHDLSEPVSEDEIYEELQQPQPLIDNRRKFNDSGSEDTDDEIERVRQRQKKAPVKKIKTDLSVDTGSSDAKDKISVKTDVKIEDEMMDCSDSSITSYCKPQKIELPVSVKNKEEEMNVYDMETDDEEDPLNNLPLPPLSDLFIDLVFHIHQSLKSEQVALAKRYIIAHKGEIKTMVDDTVNIIICQDSSSVHLLKEQYTEITFVKPEWVLRSHDENVLLPTSHFEV